MLDHSVEVDMIIEEEGREELAQLGGGASIYPLCRDELK